MVDGLDVFTAHFADYTDQYVLIGGTACERQFTQRAVPFRGTKDLDIILIVEALNDKFVQQFYAFIRDGEYTIAEVDGKKSFYRFNKPNAKGYPYMLELFSRYPEILGTPPADIHITDIPTGEEVSSLSAILLNDDYYQLTMQHSELIDGLRIASIPCLVCLKIRAFFGNLELKEKGVDIQDDKIYKHKKDVLRLLAILDPAVRLAIPAIMRSDFENFLSMMEEEQEIVEQSLRSMKLPVKPIELIELMRTVFLS